MGGANHKQFTAVQRAKRRQPQALNLKALTGSVQDGSEKGGKTLSAWVHVPYLSCPLTQTVQLVYGSRVPPSHSTWENQNPWEAFSCGLNYTWGHLLLELQTNRI